MKIDLHTHSTYSDGTCSVAENVKQAKDIGLSYIALTDHNTIEGFADLEKAGQQYDQKVIKGCEFSTSYLGEIHMLAYLPFDFQKGQKRSESILDLSEQYLKDKQVQLAKIVDNIALDYPEVNRDEFFEYVKTLKDNDNYNRTHIAAYLIYKGLVKDNDEAFHTFLNKKGKYYVEKEDIPLSQAAKMVSKAEGLISIAHIGQYERLDDEMVKEMLSGLVPYVKDLGVELYHYDHDEEEIARIRKICQEVEAQRGVNIFYTSGSDFHGTKKTCQIGEYSGYEISEETAKQRDTDLSKTLTLFKEYQIIE